VPSSPTLACERLALDLVEGLRRELRLTPKPGLVDLLDPGSHPDLSVPLMERSIVLVGQAYGGLARSLARGEPLARQVALGQAAERRLRTALGTNTHKGALFLGGLLLVARRRAPDGEVELRGAVRVVARELLTGRPLPESHGAAARRRFGVGGVVAEALAGLPSVFQVALPAWRGATARGRRGDEPAFAMLAALMEAVEDTTALHRGGPAGLARVRRDGRELSRRLAARQDHLAFLGEANLAWRELNLTMGGVADLLGISLGLLRHLGELEPAASPPHRIPFRPRAGKPAAR
jgi:triphosphoribosyl-dephospho-CoA synthase